MFSSVAREFAFHMTMKLSLGASVGFTHTTCSHTERNSDARGQWSVPVGNSSLPTAGDPELTEEHVDHDGHEGEVDDRVLAPFELSVDPLRWLADFAMEKHWHCLMPYSSSCKGRPISATPLVRTTTRKREAWQLRRSKRDRSRVTLLRTVALTT